LFTLDSYVNLYLFASRLYFHEKVASQIKFCTCTNKTLINIRAKVPLHLKIIYLV